MKNALLSVIWLGVAFAHNAGADDAVWILAADNSGAALAAKGIKQSPPAVSPSLSAEYDAVDLGAGYSGTGLSTSRGFAVLKGQSLLGIGTLPINESFSFFGQFGVLRSDDDMQFSQSVPAYRYNSATDLTYGLGLKYDFTETLGLRLQWERMNHSGAAIPGDDVNLLSTGLRYRF